MLCMEIILVNTGNKYDEWYVHNMRYMLDRVGMQSKVHVIRDEVYESVWNKLQMFDRFKEGNYLYLDLDIVLLQNIEHLFRKDLTLLRAWWRDAFHTPLNSSVMSWSGDYSFYYRIFQSNPEYYMFKYRGIDEYIYDMDMIYHTYEPCCTSLRWHGWSKDWPVMLFNQNYEKMRESGPWSKYTLSE